RRITNVVIDPETSWRRLLWPTDERQHRLRYRIDSSSRDDVVRERRAIGCVATGKRSGQWIVNGDDVFERGEVSIRQCSGWSPDVVRIETRPRVVDALIGEEAKGLVLPVINLRDQSWAANTEAGTI